MDRFGGGGGGCFSFICGESQIPPRESNSGVNAWLGVLYACLTGTFAPLEVEVI